MKNKKNNPKNIYLQKNIYKKYTSTLHSYPKLFTVEKMYTKILNYMFQENFTKKKKKLQENMAKIIIFDAFRSLKVMSDNNRFLHSCILTGVILRRSPLHERPLRIYHSHRPIHSNCSRLS
jgi:hypothetical protein